MPFMTTFFNKLFKKDTLATDVEREFKEVTRAMNILDANINAAPLTPAQKKQVGSWFADLRYGLNAVALTPNTADKSMNITAIALKAELLKLNLNCMLAINGLDLSVATHKERAERITEVMVNLDKQFAVGLGGKNSADEFSAFRAAVQNLQTDVFNVTDTSGSSVKFGSTEHIKPRRS